MTIRETDILVDDDGDLVVGANGDLALSKPSRTAIQDIAFRVRSQHDDFQLHPLIGANLAPLVGEPNNRRNGDRIRTLVQRALTRDGRFSPDSLSIEVVPVSSEDIVILIGVIDRLEGEDDFDNDILVASFGYNFANGTMTIMR